MLEKIKNKILGEDISVVNCIIVILCPFAVALGLYPVLHLCDIQAELNDLLDIAQYTSIVVIGLVLLAIVKYHLLKK